MSLLFIYGFIMIFFFRIKKTKRENIYAAFLKIFKEIALFYYVNIIKQTLKWEICPITQTNSHCIHFFIITFGIL